MNKVSSGHRLLPAVASQAGAAPVITAGGLAPGMWGDVLACCLYPGSGVERITAIRSAGEPVGELCGQ